RWDPDLAHYAEQLAKKCTLCYDTSEIPQRPNQFIRQNIAEVGRVEEAVDDWWNRHMFYDYATKNCSEGGRCQHYLKVKLSKILIIGFLSHTYFY
uniref:SCP domain-containing protein n=1 Tax=Trichobilharzia regenti TaxID=157069 RepID=A0AA85J2A5_TRIRE